VSIPVFGPAPQQWCWPALGEVAAAEQWRDLSAWVGWLRGRYPIAEQLPACWWRHSELVEELTALRLAWLAAYTEPGAALTGPIDFHDRWLPSVLGRVRRWGVQCLGEHRPRPPSIYDGAAVDDPADFAQSTGATHAEAGLGAIGASAPPGTHAAPGGWLLRLPASAVRVLLDEGYARTTDACGASAGAPVVIGADYWLPAGAVYARVTDPVLHGRLAAEHPRSASTARDPGPGAAPGPVPDDSGVGPRRRG